MGIDDLDLDLDWGDIGAPPGPSKPDLSAGLPSQDDLPLRLQTPAARPPRAELPTLLDDGSMQAAAMAMEEPLPEEEDDGGRRTVMFDEIQSDRATLPPPADASFEDALLRSMRNSMVSASERPATVAVPVAATAPPIPTSSRTPSLEVDELDALDLDIDLDMDFGLPPASKPAPSRPPPQLKLTPRPTAKPLTAVAEPKVTAPPPKAPPLAARPTPARPPTSPAPRAPFRVPTGRTKATPAPAPAAPDVSGLEAEMIGRFEQGDYGGALHRAERILEEIPGHEKASSYATASREMLVQLYLGRVGDLEDPVVLSVPASELKNLSLDHRAGYLVAQIDGASTLAELLDVSSMPALETARMLFELHQQGVIATRPRRSR